MLTIFFVTGSNFVFLDERTRRSAYAALSDGLAKEMLREFAGYDLLYVAVSSSFASPLLRFPAPSLVFLTRFDR